jgi:epsilon-lactone hydrolase
MTSIKARLFNLLLRNRHLFQGKLKKEVFDFNTSITGFRELCERGAKKYSRIPAGVEVKSLVIEGLPSEWPIPARPDVQGSHRIHG